MTKSDSRSIVILTGAGISRESGLDTFRDKGGIWDKYSPQVVASIEGFNRQPELVQEFYNARRKELVGENIKPNKAHIGLAELQKLWTGKCSMVTQNIDNLHEKAESRNVIHIHGEAMKVLCRFCGSREKCEKSISVQSVCAKCKKIGGMRPDVVFFGEIPYYLPAVYCLLQECRIFIAIGTAGAVYPAAGFVEQAENAEKIEINLQETEISHLFDQNRYGKASIEVPKLVNELLE